MSVASWQRAIQLLLHGAAPTRFYYALEFFAILFGVIACILLLKRRPELGLYGLAMIAFAVTTGPAQGMVRYVLTAPAIFWVLARLGKNPVFDRVWTLSSVLIMGLETVLYTFDFWVA